jgi:hypothetical protein
MKYLKKFEADSWSSMTDKKIIKEDVLETANNYLAYLIDDGFETGINIERDWITKHNTDIIDLHIFKANGFTDEESTRNSYFSESNNFSWITIKNHFIPFLIMFSREYSYTTLKFYSYYGDDVMTFRPGSILLNNILEDKFEDNTILKEIVITNIRKL